MAVMSETEIIRIQYDMLMKEIHHIEHKVAIIERSKKDAKANDNLLSIGNELKKYFHGVSTQDTMDDLRGD